MTAKKSKAFDLEYSFPCGCEVRLMVAGEIEPKVVRDDLNSIDYCDEHGYPEAQASLTVEDNLTLLANGGHHLSCSRDKWCDCRSRLANDALAELGAA